MGGLSRPKYYLDTYAMVEFLRGNAAYERYFSGGVLTTSMLNLMELYYAVLRKEGEKDADRAYLAFRNFQTEITAKDIKEGMKMRLRLRAGGSRASYVDVVGYQVALRVGAKYLTGDREFKSFPNVEFVR